MPKLVVLGATIACDKGTSPASLSVLPGNDAEGAGKAVATVQDFAPMVNVPAFGMCTTQANPQVATATTAAQGVLTPQPCVPVITSPWSPGATEATLRGAKALTANSTCSCAWSGSVSVKDPGTEIDVE